MQANWAHTEISYRPRKNISASKKTRFVESSPQSDSDPESPAAQSPKEQEEPISKKDFCKILRKNKGPCKIRLHVSCGRLVDPKETDSTNLKLSPDSSVSLAEVLTSYDLSTKMKCVLAYTLARSIWQYYDSNWTMASWTYESIHFMMERDHLSPKPCT